MTRSRADATGRERQRAGAERDPRLMCRKGAPDRKPRQEIDAEQRHLIAAQDDAGRHEAGGDAVEDRAARQRAIEKDHGDRQVGEAQHLADVLDAPGHRRPVAEGQRRDQSAGPVPALVAEPQHQRRAAQEHTREHGGIDRPQAGRAVQKGEHQEGRGEDHRLRVGDLRMPAEHEGRPGRGFAAREALRQELDLRLEVGLGVPGDRHAARQPGPADDERREQEDGQRERHRMRRSGSQHSRRSRRMVRVCGPARGVPL